jgi:lipopolysaccharide transport system ATP-binding protein
MNNPIISVENLGKSYRIGKLRAKPTSFRAAVRHWAATPFQYLATQLRAASDEETLWALRDVSFEVGQGEVLGVIGQNGAGKSTLLKILSRITDPTEGRAHIRGTVNSLLEVGTGFHPDLTGRENIYMNAALHGVKRNQVNRKLADIIEFAEIDKFMDTPVKRYSSGMYTRLAFAVAAHFEPDVLIVDEVLAVGDVAFQKKCLGRMGDVVQQGRTILFVSHNMSALLSLCPNSILLHEGRMVMRGATAEVLGKYVTHSAVSNQTDLRGRTDRGGNGDALITKMTMRDAGGGGSVVCRSNVSVQIHYESPAPIRSPKVLISLRDQLGQAIYFLDSAVAGGLPSQIDGRGVITCETGALNIVPGPIYVNVALYSSDTLLDHLVDATRVDVMPDDFFGTGRMLDRSLSFGLLSQKWGTV